MLAAETKCRKLRMGNVPYSPQLIQHALSINFWKLQLKKQKGLPVSSCLLQWKRCQAQIPLQSFSNLSIQDIQNQIHHHQQQWNQKKKEAIQLRKAFLDEKAKALTGPSTTHAKALRHILNNEQTRHHYRLVKHTIHRVHSLGLTNVYGTPDSQGLRPHHIQQDSISKCCIQANKEKYRQTEHTLFMSKPLVNAVNYDGISPASNTILQGTFHEPTLHPHTAAHIRELARPPGLPPWPNHYLQITPKEHADAWRKAKEYTLSSLSGLHFGLWKANATHDILCELDTLMRAIPFQTGYALCCWCQGVDMELQKDSNNWNIERLRTIVLIEAAHNLNNKLLGRRVMEHAEKHQAIAPEQHGSRKRLSSMQASVNNRLMYDLMRQHRHGGILCSNDAKLCYDRIVHSVLSLSLQ